MNKPAIFDASLAIERAGGNRDLAVELFGMLINELPNFRGRIVNAYGQQDHKELQEAVHKLNGSSTYCGVPALKEAANDYEVALKAGEEARFAEMQQRLIGEIDELVNSADSLTI